ncbi:MAG: SMC-Scp complex subunit ScpB [Alloalcanivorax venustensis]|uniref:SMC-Scp complex subunit ScpB n=1 Tax=Alloalcanivorax venustensis TaxID=172371 RepID=UPI00079B6CAC|nr:MAG: segregation and condensation protein B [Alcanivorax sp. Nap_24]MAK22272.1 SMC-Scp complex subunit ScpB [Alcanivorax sp.]MEA3260701.1 SMC-Scp complex subunit ScpB [Pseudomonadota bacterium]SMO84823.1 condensin subunit ScpB [Alcanivorax sp. DSM 26295]MAQ35088.1 SMC-Scp complex subunit ScpB [Alcanivorax sp.]
MEPDKIKQIVEAAIFAADGPLDRDALLLLFDEQERPEKADLSRSLEQISEDYAERGIELKEVASGFRFQVRKDLGPWVSRLWQEKPPRYSRAILETLALVAYRQPITRGEIEEIRGVSVSSHIIKSLLERNWVRVVGHRDVPGRPAMFATTRQFLDYFDLKSLEDLPPLSEIKDLDKLNEELALSDAPDPDSGDRADDDNDATAAFGARTEGEREARNEEIFAALDEEPELDDSTLMSIDKVDSVNAGFEEEFRRKPAPAEGTGEQAAKAADEDEQSPHE